MEVIKRLEALKTGGIRISNYFSDIPEIDFVYINPNFYSDPQWKNVQGYSGINQMSIDKLEQTLITKGKKAKNYRICDTYWLLVVIDSFDRAQEQVIPQEILNGKVKLASNFYEKIILFQTAPELVLELQK